MSTFHRAGVAGNRLDRLRHLLHGEHPVYALNQDGLAELIVPKSAGWEKCLILTVMLAEHINLLSEAVGVVHLVHHLIVGRDRAHDDPLLKSERNQIENVLKLNRADFYLVEPGRERRRNKRLVELLVRLELPEPVG